MAGVVRRHESRVIRRAKERGDGCAQGLTRTMSVGKMLVSFVGDWDSFAWRCYERFQSNLCRERTCCFDVAQRLAL